MKKKQYVSPDAWVVHASDLEGIICTSMRMNLHVNPLNNINAEEEALEEEARSEEFLFRS